MNTSPVLKTIVARRIMALGLASAVLITLFVGVRASSAWGRGDSVKRRSLPSGQLQADARTLIAAFNFLLDFKTDATPAVSPATALCAGNFGVQPTASFCCVSNQSESLSEPATNGPARS